MGFVCAVSDWLHVGHCSSGLGRLEAWGLMAPVEFLGIGYSISLVFSLMEVDDSLSFRGHSHALKLCVHEECPPGSESQAVLFHGGSRM